MIAISRTELEECLKAQKPLEYYEDLLCSKIHKSKPRVINKAYIDTLERIQMILLERVILEKQEDLKKEREKDD